MKSYICLLLSSQGSANIAIMSPPTNFCVLLHYIWPQDFHEDFDKEIKESIVDTAAVEEQRAVLEETWSVPDSRRPC